MAIYVSYLNIQDSAVTPASTWNAYLSTDSGNNTGWAFSNTELGVNVTSVTGVGQTGNTSVTGIGNINLTGVQGIGQVGTLIAAANANVATTGLQASGQIGSVVVGIGATVTGLQSIGQTGALTVQVSGATAVYVSYLDIQDSNVTTAGSWYAADSVDSGNNAGWVFNVNGILVKPSGVQSIGNIGDASVTGSSVIGLTNVTGIGEIGTTTVGEGIGVTTTGLQAPGQIGSVVIGIGATVIGVQAIGQVGTISTTANANVALTSVTGVGIIGNVLVWGQVNDYQNPNWQLIAA
jgi:hypothetical protein